MYSGRVRRSSICINGVLQRVQRLPLRAAIHVTPVPLMFVLFLLPVPPCHCLQKTKREILKITL